MYFDWKDHQTGPRRLSSEFSEEAVIQTNFFPFLKEVKKVELYLANETIINSSQKKLLAVQQELVTSIMESGLYVPIF